MKSKSHSCRCVDRNWRRINDTRDYFAAVARHHLVHKLLDDFGGTLRSSRIIFNDKLSDKRIFRYFSSSSSSSKAFRSICLNTQVDRYSVRLWRGIQIKIALLTLSNAISKCAFIQRIIFLNLNILQYSALILP